MDSESVAALSAAVWRRRWLALVVLVLVLVADAAFTWSSPRLYQARASMLIAPSTSLEPGQLVYSVDALGRAMIVGTYADVLATDVVRHDAFARAGVPSVGAEPDVEIKAAARADSAVVQITTVAHDPNLAASIANAVGQAGEARMGVLYPMYELSFVTRATPPTTLFRPDITRNLSIGILLGLALGCAAAWAYDGFATRGKTRID
jgi:capsular polysaccharide biosynthesis protein